MTTTAPEQVQAPAKAIQPDALNHLVLNVTDLERSHKFWSEIIGFVEVVSIRDSETGIARSRFYRGKDGTQHHDLALFQIADAKQKEVVEEWTMAAREVGVNHVAIKYHDRDAWLQQIAFLQSRGVTFHSRGEHGMTHSVYISDPDGYGIEVLYEVPRYAWIDNPGAAVIWGRSLPKDGPEALEDDDNYHVFKANDPVVPDFAPKHQ